MSAFHYGNSELITVQQKKSGPKFFGPDFLLFIHLQTVNRLAGQTNQIHRLLQLSHYKIGRPTDYRPLP